MSRFLSLRRFEVYEKDWYNYNTKRKDKHSGLFELSLKQVLFDNFYNVSDDILEMQVYKNEEVRKKMARYALEVVKKIMKGLESIAK